MRAMGRVALESEEALAVIYERALRDAGTYYASQFRKEAVVAAADWQRPNAMARFNSDRALTPAEKQREEAAREVERTFSREAGRQIAISFDPRDFRLFSPELMENIGKHAGRNFDAAANEELTRVIRGSFDSGLTVPQTAKEIRRSFADMSKAKATMLARTDLVGLANGGNYMAARMVFQFEKQPPLKVWLNAHDARVRPSHVEANGQKVPMESPFRVGGHELMYPGDPQAPAQEVIHCRCTFTVEDQAPKRVRQKETPGDPPIPRLTVPTPPPPPVAPPPPAAPTMGMPPSFATTAEATTWLQEAGLANSTNFGTMALADVQQVVEGLATARPYVQRPLGEFGLKERKSRALAVYSRLRLRGTTEIIGQSIQFQKVVANQKTIATKAAAARDDFARSKANILRETARQARDETRPAQLRRIAHANNIKAQETQRWTVWEHAPPDRHTFALIAHEAGHYVYFERGLELKFEQALYNRGFKSSQRHKVSKYGATSTSELWAEAFSARAVGMSDVMPVEVMEAMEEVLASATV
jgi:Phage Mu protein F like protein